MSRLPTSARRGLYFGLQRAIGSRINETWREFLRWEKFSKDHLSEAVDESVSRLLTEAATQSAYYRKLGLQRQPSESAQDFLQRFPILTREKLRENFPEIVTDFLRRDITSPAAVSPKRYDWLVVKTGGTTGVPTSVVHDAHARDWGRATRLFSARACGFPLGTQYFRLWGSESDLLKTKASLQARVLQNLLGEIPLNAFRAKEGELRKHLQIIQSHPEVRHLMAYVDAATSLALFVEEKELPRPRFETVMACAGTVTAEWRRILKDTFSAEVFDKYGSRECCDIACECRFHTGLHVYSPNVFVEIVDELGRVCSPGRMGRILVTSLNNFSFPMIRYQIGDVGEWSVSESCECGLPFPRIGSIQGRQDDMLVTEDGTLVSSAFVRHFVGVSMNHGLIREWQLEQTGSRHFIFRYIPLAENGLAENVQKIKEGFQLVLGKSTALEVTRVAEIPSSATGKIRWVINAWKK